MNSPDDTEKNGDKAGDDQLGRLHIFVNRRKFEEGDGVRPEMSGGQIAALVEVPAANAIVRLERDGGTQEIAVTQKIKIKNGMSFLVTRKVVEGGHELRTD